MAGKNNSVVEIALKYWIDGKSLIEAQQKAQQEFNKLNKTAKARNRQQQQADQKRILSESKKLNNQLLRASVASAKKEAKERAAIDTKAAAQRKKTLSGGFDNFGGKLGTISAYGAAIKIIQSLQQAVTFAVKSVIEFEVAFTDLAVKSGFNNKEMSKVSETIMSVAASTRFSTLEIVSAATALGKLGFEASEVGEILPNLANVAAATGESLQATAEILGKVINAYKYTAEQSGIISDRMVDIFNNSALNLEKFNTAFSYVGSAAASTGTSFDELTSAMAILSDRGITASKIGTGLRNVFTKLGREGDSLRDILQRVSDEHLSFYEVAELVGRRAANQLFIMANSLDEFDSNVARSMEDYGEALKAAAIQQSTFQAKWDIMQNSFKNAFAPTFDPNQDFRTAMKESLGLMDRINARFNNDNSEAIMTRTMARFPELAEQFRDVKEAMRPDADDKNILFTLITELSLEAVGATGKAKDAIIDEIAAINTLMAVLPSFGAGKNTMSSALLKMDEAKVKNAAQELAIKFQKELTNAIDKTNSYNDTTEANKFIDTIFGTEAEFKAGLDRIKEFGRITEAQYNFLLKNQQGQKSNLYDTNFKSNNTAFKKKSEDTLVDVLKRQYKERQKVLKDVNQGSLVWTKNSIADNKRVIQRGMDELEDVRDELCSKYPAAAASVGIKCDEKTAKRDTFKRDASLDAQYEIDKSKLEIQYRNEDDPIAKSGINDELILVEITYRDKLNKIYENYLKTQEDARADYIKRNPTKAAAFDENVQSVTDRQTKDAAAGTKNENKYNLRDITASQNKWEADFNEKKAYGLKNAILDNQLKDTDRNNAKDRKKIRDEMNKNTREYYAKELKNAEDFFDELEREIIELEYENVQLIFEKKNPIDISKKKDLFAKKDGTIDKSKTDEQKALKMGSGKDNKDFDYFGATIGAFDEITGLITQAGEARLEVMQQQADAELAIIQGRHEAEMGILDSALNAGIISQDDAAAAKDRADKRKIQKENKVAKKMFDAQKKIDMQTAIFTGISSTAQAIAQAFANSPNPAAAAVFASISAAAIAASTAMNIKGISQRKFIPKKFADGGMVEGASHAQGGVPFTVRGRGGYEMEGGEFIVNKEAAKNNLAELERINGKTRTGKRKFATGGTVTASSDDSTTAMNEALIEALSKPVRAFVTTQDLEKSESERNALAKKTSY
tara:strand:- start:6999 stop:10577 length:3579 start_codon:yes stop_codon:yes gene_type:complete